VAPEANVWEGFNQRRCIGGIEEFVVLCGVVGFISMKGSSQSRMEETNGVPNYADEERSGYVVIS
jgi:hypothetical protein